MSHSGGADLAISISHHCSADISAPLMLKQRPQISYAAISFLNNPEATSFILFLSGSSSHRAASGPSTMQRKQRSQSLERPAKSSHQDKMTASLPRPNNYNISDPDMIASKLAEQEYLQSLGINTHEILIQIHDLVRKSFEQILLVFYTKLLYLFCLPTTDSISIHIKALLIRN